MKKGIKVRFHDIQPMLGLQPDVFEFHFSDKDLDTEHSFRDAHFDEELVVHAPEYYKGKLIDLCSDNSQSLHHSREESVRLIQRVIDETAKISKHFSGRPMIVLHPGGMHLKRITNKEKVDELRENLKKSLSELDKKNIPVLVENMPPYPWFFGGQWNCHVLIDAEEIRKFCEETGYDFCFDLSHAQLYCKWAKKDLVEFVKKVKPIIKHVHFADADGVDGEGMQIDEGEIDFSKIMPFFHDLEMDDSITMIPEVWRGHEKDGKGFKIAFERLNKHLGNINIEDIALKRLNKYLGVRSIENKEEENKE